MFKKLLLVIPEIVVFVQYYVYEGIRLAAGGKPVKRVGIDVVKHSGIGTAVAFYDYSVVDEHFTGRKNTVFRFLIYDHK